MEFLDFIDLNRIRRAISYLLVALAAIWLQTAVLSRLFLTGVRPFFIPLLPVAVGLWEGGFHGGVYGLVTGLLCDISYTESTMRFMILFTLLGFFAGLLGEFFINRRFFAYLLLSVIALGITAAVQTVPLWIFREVALEELLPVALLQGLLSLPFTVPVYLTVRAVFRAA